MSKDERDARYRAARLEAEYDRIAMTPTDQLLGQPIKIERQSLLAWRRDGGLDSITGEMLWKEAAIRQVLFFAEKICPLFYKSPKGYSPEARAAFENLQHACKIGGWHTSKSVEVPVYCLAIPDITIIARYNFCNWNVTVLSKRALVFDDYLNIDGASGYLFFEGMPTYWQRGTCKEDCREFSFCKWSDEELFAVMWCIASQVDKYDGREPV